MFLLLPRRQLPPHIPCPYLFCFPFGQVCSEASAVGKGGREGGGGKDLRRGLLCFSSRGDKDPSTFKERGQSNEMEK